MTDRLSNNDIKLRQARLDDIRQVYDLAMDDLVRQNSFNPQPFSLEAHKTWYERKLKDENFILLIAEHENHFAGQVKFDINGSEALIGVSITPPYRGRGLGYILITQGVRNLKKTNPYLKVINAFIKKDNIVSIKIFEKSGFTFSKETVENSVPALKYVLTL